MANRYLDLAGAIYLIGKIKTLLSGKADSNHTHTKGDIGLENVENKSSETIRGEITKANVTAALGYTPPGKDTNTWIALNGATASAAGTAGYAPAPAAGTNTTQAASTAFVSAAITAAMSGITGIDFSVVNSLPTTGKKGVFYLISNSGSGQNIYDEYI